MDEYIYSAGLCAVCANVQIVESPRGPVYFLCGLSKINPAFAKYPQLPVLRCLGYRPQELDENADPQSSDDSTG